MSDTIRLRYDHLHDVAKLTAMREIEAACRTGDPLEVYVVSAWWCQVLTDLLAAYREVTDA